MFYKSDEEEDAADLPLLFTRREQARLSSLYDRGLLLLHIYFLMDQSLISR